MKTEQQTPAVVGDTEAKPPEARPSIRFTVNTVLHVGGFQGSKFFAAGSETPFREPSEVPESLRGFVAPAEPLETAESDDRFANFQLNTAYLSNSDGSRGRALRRQAGELAASASFQQWAEEQASAPLDEQTAEALKIAQEQHAVDVAVQIKSLEISAEYRDGRPEAIMAERGEEAKQEQEARVTIPAPVLEERSEPKRRRK